MNIKGTTIKYTSLYTTLARQAPYVASAILLDYNFLGTIAISAAHVGIKYISGGSMSMRECTGHALLNMAGLLSDIFIKKAPTLDDYYQDLAKTADELTQLTTLTEKLKEASNSESLSPQEKKEALKSIMDNFESALIKNLLNPMIAHLQFGIYKSLYLSELNIEKTSELYLKQNNSSNLLNHGGIKPEYDHYIKIRELAKKIIPSFSFLTGSSRWNNIVRKAIEGSTKIEHNDSTFTFRKISEDQLLSTDDFKKFYTPIIKDTFEAKRTKGQSVREKILTSINSKTSNEPTPNNDRSPVNLSHRKNDPFDHLSQTMRKISQTVAEAAEKPKIKKIKTRSTTQPLNNKITKKNKTTHEDKNHLVDQPNSTPYPEKIQDIANILRKESPETSIKLISKSIRIYNNHTLKMDDRLKKLLPDKYKHDQWGIQFQLDADVTGRQSIVRVAAFPATLDLPGNKEKIWVISKPYTNH